MTIPKKAFTLIEVLVTSVILSFVLAGAASFIIIGTKITDETILQAQAQSMLNRVVSDLTSKIKEGNNVEIKEISNQGISGYQWVVSDRPKGEVGAKITWFSSFTNNVDTHYLILPRTTENGILKQYEYPGIKTKIYCVPVLTEPTTVGNTYSIRYRVFVELENKRQKKYRTPTLEFNVKTRNNKYL